MLKAQRKFQKIFNKKSKGFTLVELVVTVSILGVVAAFAVPNFTTMVKNNRIKSTTNHIIGSLQFARQTAQSEQVQTVVCSPPLTPDPSRPFQCKDSNDWKNGLFVVKKKGGEMVSPPAGGGNRGNTGNTGGGNRGNTGNTGNTAGRHTDDLTTELLLNNNPFKVTVTYEPYSATSANHMSSNYMISYKKDRSISYGKLYIEDDRGRGEHSRTICMNMLGNIKVVKGNETCP